MKYKSIVWDWNGTLFDDVHLCMDIINNVIARRNLPPLSLERYHAIFTFPIADYYKRTGLTFETETFEEVGKEWMTEYQERRFSAKLFPAAVPVLSDLRAQGYKQSILSAYMQESVLEMLAAYNVREFFNEVRGLDNIYAASKESIGQNLLTSLGIPGNQTVLIGDTLHDFDVASALGVDCILAATGHQSYETLQTAGVPVVHSLEEICKYV